MNSITRKNKDKQRKKKSLTKRKTSLRLRKDKIIKKLLNNKILLKGGTETNNIIGGDRLPLVDLKLPRVDYHNDKKSKSNNWSVVKGKSNVCCVSQTSLKKKIYLNNVNVNIDEDSSKTYYLLWVRHCHSCSNQAHPVMNFRNKFVREPLCSGIDSLNRAINLGKYLREHNDDINFSFFSSYLARAMETAKAISFGFTSEETSSSEHSEETSSSVQLLKFVSEELNRIDKRLSNGSQNKTFLEKSKHYATFLNQNLNGFNIKYKPEDTEEGISSEGVLDDYKDFLTKYILGEDSILKPVKPDEKNVNVIVSHGGYIRQNIWEGFQLLDEPSSEILHPDNVQPFLVKVVVNTVTNEIECDLINTDLFFKKTNYKLYGQPCEISYESDIQPT